MGSVFSGSNPQKSIGKRILLLEDDVALRRLLTDVLHDEGHSVTGMDDAHMARLILTQQPWDLVITDGSLKASCGEEFAHHVAESGLNIPVLFMTGSIRTIENPDIYAGVMRKPFVRAEFLEFVDKALNDSSSDQQAA